MSKYIVVLIWPAGLAIIAGCAYLLARRRPGMPAPGKGGGRHHSRTSSGGGAVTAAARLVILSGIVSAGVFCVMCLLGLVVVNHGITIDKPIFSWITGHKVHAAAAAMNRLTKIGDTWTTWG